MRPITSAFLLFCICLAGCTKDVTTVEVVRNPLIKFNIDSANASWQSSNYTFSSISKVVVYPQDTTKPGQLYNRITFQSSGKDNSGNTLQLIVAFDAVDLTQLSGVYTSSYTTQRGLAQVQLYNLTNSSNLAAYSLCDQSISNAEFQIEKQDPDEQLITGSFHMTLCGARDSTNKINITNGIFTDLTY
jgi:hypothetical protein